MANLNQIISVRYTAAEKQRLEAAAALAGYDTLTAYIRDRSLARGSAGNAGQDFGATDVSAPLLFDLQREQAKLSGILAILLALTVRRSTSGDLHAVEADLMRAQELGVSADKLLALLLPEWQRHLVALAD